MAYVDSSSTRAEVLAALDDNASWLADQDLAKAKLYHTAGIVWLQHWALDESETGPSRVRFDELNKSIRANVDAAARFIGTMPSTAIPSAAGNVVRLSVRNFRR